MSIIKIRATSFFGHSEGVLSATEKSTEINRRIVEKQLLKQSQI